MATWSRAASRPNRTDQHRPLARHVAEVASRRPDLKFAIAAAVDLHAAGEVPLGHRRATLDGAARPHLRHAAPASGARAVPLPLSAPARRSALLAAVSRRSPSSLTAAAAG